jgi:hypothetical protein
MTFFYNLFIKELYIMSLDSLAYASMENSLLTQDDMKTWRNMNITGISADTTSDQIQSKLNKILSNTTLKRACCLQQPDQSSSPDNNVWQIPVRIPVFNSSQFTSETKQKLVPYEKSYNYYDKIVKIPKTMCNSIKSPDGKVYNRPKMGSSTTTNCDDFYSVYCKNMLSQYYAQSNEVGNTADAIDFANNFKRECACFTPLDVSVKVARRCLSYPQCVSNSNNNAYLDPDSRLTCPENLTVSICKQVFNISENKAGGNITVSPQLKEKCSATDKNNTSGGTPSGTPGGTSSENTNKNTDEKTSENTESGSENKLSEKNNKEDNGGDPGNPVTNSDWLSLGMGLTDTEGTVFIIIAVLLILVLCGVSLFFILRKKKRR